MNVNNKLPAAFAAGILIGTILGILFAAGKGSETRIQISDACKKFVGKINKKMKIFPDLEKEIELAVKEAVTQDTDEMMI